MEAGDTKESDTRREAAVAMAARRLLEDRVGSPPRAFAWRELSVRETRGMMAVHAEHVGVVGDYDSVSGHVVLMCANGRSLWVPVSEIWIIARRKRG